MKYALRMLMSQERPKVSPKAQKRIVDVQTSKPRCLCKLDQPINPQCPEHGPQLKRRHAPFDFVAEAFGSRSKHKR